MKVLLEGFFLKQDFLSMLMVTVDKWRMDVDERERGDGMPMEV